MYLKTVFLPFVLTPIVQVLAAALAQDPDEAGIVPTQFGQIGVNPINVLRPSEQ